MPAACRVKITVGEDVYCAEDFDRAKILYTAPLISNDKNVGGIAVGYIEEELAQSDCRLLTDEIKLIYTFAFRIAEFIVDKQR